MNTIDELRAMAEQVLSEHPDKLYSDERVGSFKKLLEELSIYQIELEHQNRELERSEREIAAAHEEYVRLFEATPVGYVILDSARKIVRANQTFISYFVPPLLHDAVFDGLSFDTFVIEEFKNAFSLFCKMAQTQKVPVPIELKLQDRTGAPRYVLLTACAYAPEKQQIALTASDISMQKRMEEQLARAKDTAEEADRKKSRFLTNVGHELRTPLSTIIGYGSLIEDPRISDAEKHDFFKNILTASKMLLRLTDDVLNVSSLESGETPLRNQVVNMEKLCADMVRLLARRFLGKNVLLVARSEGVPLLWTDQLRLTQIIYSVLEHAAGNATEGEILLKCSFEQTNEKYGLLVMLFTGREIFSSENNFEQDLNHTPVSPCAASLGLYLMRRIVKAMNGQMIWEHPLDSLRVEIPVEISPFLEQNRVSETSSADLAVMNSVHGQKTCLLVDDVAVNLKVLGMMMEKLGYTSILAMSGEEALELMKKTPADLVMTDLWMPKMSGEELAMMLRQNPDYDKVPILAVTADLENANNFDMDFFDGTIIKPVSREKLMKALKFMKYPLFLKNNQPEASHE